MDSTRDAPAPDTPPSAPPAQGGDGPRDADVLGVMLSDIVGRDRSINVFAGLARDVESVARRLDDPSRGSTVLAPLNSALDALSGKPWEKQGDYGALGADAYEGEDGRERARRNLRRFVEAHVVPASPWPAGQKTRTVGDGSEVWWEERDGGVKVVQPGNIEVIGVAGKVSNGQVWIIKGVCEA